MMTYLELMQAARSDDPRIRERGRDHFLMRLRAIRCEDRLLMIERDVLCRLYGMDPATVHAVWVKGVRK
jgi:hypothetical protein